MRGFDGSPGEPVSVHAVSSPPDYSLPEIETPVATRLRPLRCELFAGSTRDHWDERREGSSRNSWS